MVPGLPLRKGARALGRPLGGTPGIPQGPDPVSLPESGPGALDSRAPPLPPSGGGNHFLNPGRGEGAEKALLQPPRLFRRDDPSFGKRAVPARNQGTGDPGGSARPVQLPHPVPLSPGKPERTDPLPPDPVPFSFVSVP